MAGLLVLLGAACPATGIALASQPADPADPGPIRDLDREFLTVIRFANLWEIPMGDLATKRGSSQKVRDVGAVILADHTKLNGVVEQLAGQFNVPLPDEPTSSQQSWMAEISSKSGVEFDKAFADRLRAAHGTVFGLVAEVRSGTRNETIRGFAQQANDIVMKHMTLLEGTGQVSADHGMFAEASARTTDYPENTLARRDIVLAIVAALVMIVGTLGVVRVFNTRGSAE